MIGIEHKDPATQFQIGDKVLYLKEGVLTIVTAYFWLKSVGELPTIVGYDLECGGGPFPASSIEKHKWVGP